MKFAIYMAVAFQLVNLKGYTSEAQQRVPPGVNPQHYQQQQQYQHQVHYQQQQQQQPPQVHQVPVQQIPVQVPVQQVPIQQQQHHPHVGSGRPSQILDPSHIAEEKEHIAEHIDVPIDTSKMTEQELQFHYFKMHDADNNNKLDGCELIKSLIHWHEQEGKDHTQHQTAKGRIFKDDELITLIDPILSTDDNNRDGYIDYPEFITAQQKVASSSQQTKP